MHQPDPFSREGFAVRLQLPMPSGSASLQRMALLEATPFPAAGHGGTGVQRARLLGPRQDTLMAAASPQAPRSQGNMSFHGLISGFFLLPIPASSPFLSICWPHKYFIPQTVSASTSCAPRL